MERESKGQGRALPDTGDEKDLTPHRDHRKPDQSGQGQAKWDGGTRRSMIKSRKSSSRGSGATLTEDNTTALRGNWMPHIEL
ncbi:hypothetical protein FRC00_005343 [Tulasnella sp. 408]|nr:hypothetical protein FRC00_005343 [Tulasnella sp. 408]